MGGDDGGGAFKKKAKSGGDLRVLFREWKKKRRIVFVRYEE